MTDETKEVPSGADLDAVAAENKAAEDTAAVQEAPAQEAPVKDEEPAPAEEPAQEPIAEAGQAQGIAGVDTVSLEDRVAALEAQNKLLLELLDKHGIRQQ
jgi:hypothetical protein